MTTTLQLAYQSGIARQEAGQGQAVADVAKLPGVDGRWRIIEILLALHSNPRSELN